MPGTQAAWEPEPIDLQHIVPDMLRSSGCVNKAGQETRNGDACCNRSEQRKSNEGCDIGEGKGDGE